MIGAALLTIALFAPQVVVENATPEQEAIIRDAWALTLDTYSHQGCDTPKGIKVKVTGPNFPSAARYYEPGELSAKAKVKINPFYVYDWVLVHEFGHHWNAICNSDTQRDAYTAALGAACWTCGTHSERPHEIWAEDFRIGAGVNGPGNNDPSPGYGLLWGWYG